MSDVLGRLRIAGFPGRYLQGPGALAALPQVVTTLGARSVLVISDDVVDQAVGSRIRGYFLAAGIDNQRLRFPGECTQGTIDALAATAHDARNAVIVGLGGGKTIDTAKGVAHALGARLVIAPTIASNDSATSSLIVLYDDAHRVLGAQVLPRSPDVVLVDTLEIVRAPVRYFRAGIGDALSKTFEARQCRNSGGLNFFGGLPPAAAGVMADRCHAAILECGETAVQAVLRQECTPEVETVTEATVLLSGLGFESGGLSIAHALIRGLSGVPRLSRALHGEMVTFGTVVQLVLERRSADEIAQHVAMLERMGMSARLAALGAATLTAVELASVAELTLAAPYTRNFVRSLDHDSIVAAILEADRLGSAGTAVSPH